MKDIYIMKAIEQAKTKEEGDWKFTARKLGV
jgi:hypothetical protein